MGTSYNPKIVTDGLVAYYDASNSKSYPGIGSTWYDLSPFKNHLRWTSPAPTFTTVAVGNANIPVISTTPTYTSLRAILCTTYNGMRTGTGPYSAICIYQPNQITSQKIILSFGPADNNCNGTSVHPISTNNSRFVGGSCGGFGTWANNSGQTITTTRFWHHCTTYNGTTETVYVNGSYDKNSSMSSNTPISSANGICIGWIRNDGASYSMDAQVGLIMIYNRILSTAEIQNNYYTLRGRFGI